MKEFLKNNHKLVILGIGNELRGDDFLGSLASIKLTQLFQDRDDIVVFDGGTVPENFTGAIKKEKPTHIILLDAADMGKRPGFIKIIKKDEIAQYHLSTHAMPLSFLIKYLEDSTKAKIILIGIQPKEMELINQLSDEIGESVGLLIDLFDRLLS